MTTVIFDIDGTLIESMTFDSELYLQAVKEVLGDVNIYDDWGKYNHVTDPGILLQICKENHIPEAKEKAMEVRQYFGELMSVRLSLESCKPKKGAIAAVENITAHPNFVVGYATGGWGHTAEMKLRSAGLFNRGIPLFSGDHHHERAKIMKLCRDHINPLGKKPVYVGDAQWDLEAARQLGWGFVGIGERLKDLAEVWIPHYADNNWTDALNKTLQRA
jgi:beta-phosphoglucomutase-like phosphatase (HAD superfamily)